MPVALPDMPAPVRTLDTSGRLCPFPIVETAKAVRTLEAGAVLLVISTDAGIATDMPMWCKATRTSTSARFETDRRGRAGSESAPQEARAEGARWGSRARQSR